MTLIKRFWPAMLGGALGALAGWGYWAFVGCNSGSCPITSNPLISTIYGAFVGILLAGTFKK
jgi:hypothetical protein